MCNPCSLLHPLNEARHRKSAQPWWLNDKFLKIERSMPKVKKVQRELYVYWVIGGRVFLWIRGEKNRIRGKELEGKRKIKINLRILLMKVENSKEFYKLFNFEYSSNRKPCPCQQLHSMERVPFKSVSQLPFFFFRAGKGLHPTIQIFKLECYQSDSSYNLHKEFIQIIELKWEASKQPILPLLSHPIT